MIGVILCFLLTPIIVTTVMAFDRPRLPRPLPPPALSLRWFAQFSPTTISCAAWRRASSCRPLRYDIALVGVTTAFAVERASFAGKEMLISLFLYPSWCRRWSPIRAPAVPLAPGPDHGFARLLCGHIIITVLIRSARPGRPRRHRPVADRGGADPGRD